MLELPQERNFAKRVPSSNLRHIFSKRDGHTKTHPTEISCQPRGFCYKRASFLSKLTLNKSANFTGPLSFNSNSLINSASYVRVTLIHDNNIVMLIVNVKLLLYNTRTTSAKNKYFFFHSMTLCIGYSYRTYNKAILCP